MLPFLKMRKQRPRTVNKLQNPSWPDFRAHALSLHIALAPLIPSSRGLWRGPEELRQRISRACSTQSRAIAAAVCRVTKSGLSKRTDTHLSFPTSSSYLALQPLRWSDLFLHLYIHIPGPTRPKRLTDKVL